VVRYALEQAKWSLQWHKKGYTPLSLGRWIPESGFSLRIHKLTWRVDWIRQWFSDMKESLRPSKTGVPGRPPSGVELIDYYETEHYRVMHDFMVNPKRTLDILLDALDT